MAAYYNEIDPFKAQVIREAIATGAIAPGDVDERSIADVQPAELLGYTQCHFFAGGGFWGLALRLAGWPDDRPVWTGSCPCPSFSAAGKGEGFADPRHLWPQWARLIRECRPASIFGEQVAAAIGYGWLDLVCGDLEAEGYAVAAAVLGAHSAGAPHIRQRLYFCADALLPRGQQERGRSPGNEASDGRTGRDRCEPDGNHIAASNVEIGSGADAHSGRPKQCDARQRAISISDENGANCSGAHADGGQSGDGGIQRGGEHGLFAPDCGAGERANAHGRAGIGSESQSIERQRSARSDGESSERADTGHGVLSVGARAPGRQESEWKSERSGPESDGELGSGSDAESERERSGQPGCDSRSGQLLAGSASRCDAFDGSETDDRGQPLSPRPEGHFGDVRDWRGPGWLDPLTARSFAEAGATRGFWADCDWWYGRDGKYRPAGPGIQPLAHGSPARVGRLRMYGDAICVPAAAEFIRAFLETETGP